MSLRLTLCRGISVFIVAVIVLWPLAHMPLSRHYHINPWKLGGFGMFAAPGDLDGGVHLGVVAFQASGSGGAPLPLGEQSVQELFQFRGWRYQTFPDRTNNYTYGQVDFSTVVEEQARPVALDELPEQDRLHAIDLVTNVRMWHRQRYIVELAGHFERVIRDRGRVDRVAVLVTSASLEPLRQRVRSETCVYVVQGGSVSSRGCHSAESLDRRRLDELLRGKIALPEALSVKVVHQAG
jgi:hypothetical protein